MAKGRAWGNALGGYRRQKRAKNGRFASGSGTSKTKKVSKRAAKRAAVAKAAPRQFVKTDKGFKSPAQAGGVGKAFRHNIKASRSNKRHNKAVVKGLLAEKKGPTNKSVQSRHRKTVAAIQGGDLAGRATLGRVLPIAGGQVGKVAGAAVAQKKGWAISDKEFKKLGRSDQSAIVKRNRRVARTKVALQIAATALIVDNYARSSGLYSEMVPKAQQLGDDLGLSRAARSARRAAGISNPTPNRQGVYNITTARRPRASYRAREAARRAANYRPTRPRRRNRSAAANGVSNFTPQITGRRQLAITA